MTGRRRLFRDSSSTLTLWSYGPRSKSIGRVRPAQRFGQNVRKRREELDMTQEDLAHAASMHPTAISHIELGKRDARFNNIVRIAGALKVSPATLFDGI